MQQTSTQRDLDAAPDGAVVCRATGGIVVGIEHGLRDGLQVRCRLRNQSAAEHSHLF